MQRCDHCGRLLTSADDPPNCNYCRGYTLQAGRCPDPLPATA